MRRPVKPFAVEVRRAGRRVPQSFIPTREAEEATQPDYFTPAFDPAAREPRPSTEQSPPRRVLQDLNESAFDPLAERLQALESRLARRGRPPGSKNKAVRARAATDLSEFFDTTPEGAASPPVAVVAVPFRRRPREQRFAWIKKKLRRGERWKRRLPRILW
ncbi:MAG: hypothetical protein JOZ16_01910 [Methylobacteriaceae bacterium]|nr:hypothetical protein [Methylobacteriaceae bacterium]